MKNSVQILDLVPVASEWVEGQENFILSNGVMLNATQTYLASKIGIVEIEKIRLLKVDKIPSPVNSILSLAVSNLGLITENTIGITFRHGIYIRSEYWKNDSLLIHELTHTMQYERLGGICNFLNQYIKECIYFGYNKSPLEIEAREMESKIILNKFI
jgi:hypothetical protein